MSLEQYYEIKGEGEPIVFIHGSFATYKTWDKIVNKLSENNLCILIKLPGHGSPALGRQASTEFDLIENVITSVTKRPFTLIGHSYGGVVCLELAFKKSLAIKSMILFEPVSVWAIDEQLDPEAYSRIESFVAALFQKYQTQPHKISELVINFWSNNTNFSKFPDSIKASMNRLVDQNIEHWNSIHLIDHEEVLRNQCKVPTQLVIGSVSNPLLFLIADNLNRYLRSTNKITIEGADHGLVATHANVCTEAIEQFMVNN